MSILDQFDIAGGSVVGMRHLQPLRWKNNQDAYRYEGYSQYILAGVADGCSDGSYSEVGAQIGLGFALELARRALYKSFGLLYRASFEHSLGDDLVSLLYKYAQAMGFSVHEIVQYLLFSIVGITLTGYKTCLFWCGDGYYYLNGDEVKLQSGLGNKPQYFSYNLINQYVPMRFIYFDTSKLNSLLIATDGLSDIPDPSMFWKEDRFFRNKDQVRRQLALYNKNDGILKDDTTLIVIRRKHGDTDRE